MKILHKLLKERIDTPFMPTARRLVRGESEAFTSDYLDGKRQALDEYLSNVTALPLDILDTFLGKLPDIPKIRQEVQSIFREHDPAYGEHKVDEMLKEYTGREQALLPTLYRNYGITREYCVMTNPESTIGLLLLGIDTKCAEVPRGNSFRLTLPVPPSAKGTGDPPVLVYAFQLDAGSVSFTVRYHRGDAMSPRRKQHRYPYSH